MKALAGAFVLLALLLSSSEASAYAWMIRHDYVGCATCHLDPSGGGVLTAYGRAQGDLLLRTRYSSEEPDEADSSAEFLWGAVPLPDELMLGGSFRAMALGVFPDGAPARARAFPMQADLRAGLRAGPVRAGASLGYARSAAQPAQVTSSDTHNLISREHWLGLGLMDDQILVRAGRINVPFGVRQIEHTLWVRQATRSDINDSQQHGIALAYGSDSLRGEVMALLGNYQVSPDAFRERGAAGYLEWSPASGHAVGATTLVARAEADLFTRAPLTRQAHGLFYRGAPWKPLVLLAEVDVLFAHPDAQPMATGITGMVQADVELIQGVHAMATGELLARDLDALGPSAGGWLSAVWFFAPHLDIRLDGIYRVEDTPAGVARATTLLAQLHTYL